VWIHEPIYDQVYQEELSPMYDHSGLCTYLSSFDWLQRILSNIVWIELQLDYDNSIMQTHHKRLDKKKIQKRAYVRFPAIQRSTATTHTIRIWENIRKLLNDKKVQASLTDQVSMIHQRKWIIGNQRTKPHPVNTMRRLVTVGKLTSHEQLCLFYLHHQKTKKGQFCLVNVLVPKYQK
jgi:hypothetical protein